MAQQPGLLSRQLEAIYFNPSSPGGFRGPDALYQEAKRTIPNLSRKQVSDFIISKAAYTKHRQRRNIHRYRRVMTKYRNYLWQIDLLVFTTERYARVNSGFKYILCCIDTFSKKLWTWALKTKSADEVYTALSRRILASNPRVLKIQTDQGLEFFNNRFKEFLRDAGVQLYHSFTDKKASIVERCQRTIRNRLGKYWESTGRLRWVDVLPEITESYNNSFHRTIGMTPNQVTNSDEHRELIKSRMYPKPNRGEPGYAKYREQRIKNRHMVAAAKKKIKIGDFVRVLTDRKTFPKESDKNFSNEIFRVIGIRDAIAEGFTNYDDEPITFKIERLRGARIPRGRAVERRSIRGSFYLRELQKVKRPEVVQEPIPPPNPDEQVLNPEELPLNNHQVEVNTRNRGNTRLLRPAYNLRDGRAPRVYPR